MTSSSIEFESNNSLRSLTLSEVGEAPAPTSAFLIEDCKPSSVLGSPTTEYHVDLTQLQIDSAAPTSNYWSIPLDELVRNLRNPDVRDSIYALIKNLTLDIPDFDLRSLLVRSPTAQHNDFVFPEIDGYPTLEETLERANEATINVLYPWLLARTGLSESRKDSRHSREGGTSKIKLCTLNLAALPRWLGGRFSNDHATEVQGWSKDVDILAVQEAFTKTGQHSLDDFPFIASADDCGHAPFTQRSGIITASRYPIVKSERSFFAHVCGPEAFVKKGILMTQHRLPDGREIQCFNTHLIAEPTGISGWFVSTHWVERIRLMQLRQLYRFINQCQQPGIAQFILGDLNLDVSSILYPAASRYLGHDLFNTYQDLVFGCEAGITYDPELNERAVGKGHQRQRLDYIFCRDLNSSRIGFRAGLELTEKSATLDSHVSDHFAMTATLRLI